MNQTSKTYKCPNCGAALAYDGESEKLACAYCDSEIDIAAFDDDDDGFGADAKRSWDKYGAGKPQWKEEDEAILYSCSSCGGEIYAEKGTSATHCPYCDSPALLQAKLTGAFKPDRIIPFSISKEEAKAALQKFYKKKPLLPRAFKDENKIESMTGMYVPFWLFDCDTDNRFTFRGITKFSWRSGDYLYTRTSYYKLIRQGKLDFVDIPVDASVKLDNTLLESIEPYRLADSVPFSDGYLAGYVANRYDDTAEHCNERASERVAQSVERRLKQTTSGYLSVTTSARDIAFLRNEIEYALLPVWFLNTKYKGKEYAFAMNGQTGKVSGKLPVSVPKFLAWLSGLTVGIGAVLSLIAIFLM